ncbi:MAG: GNAT family N-acetyltransferase [Candidatus Pristimantibacillus lignocellulolyticus]|uniref:GNAT family N-acetyltransferase n=1 Tax=Candidatus Pristimantibacillus lignocellulolyticus TaxID=2994561 RepID=A0A9J6Z8X3_9BACL|nr:MAG: GNAT family N-acetyltransferase [Candidatus Pristimantibacillus lignocellulolyticus]
MTTSKKEIFVSNSPTREQIEHIYDILGDVFSVGRAFFQERMDFDSSYDTKTTWFATVDGTIASVVQIFPLHIRVGKSSLKIGAMGSVGTNPNFRGMGLAHQILNAQTEWMKNEDYDLSLLLASIHPFYEKVGWKLITEKAYSIPRPTIAPSNGSLDIIPFEPAYLDDLRAIYEQFNSERTYTVIRDESYWHDLIKWPLWKDNDCLLIRKDNRIVAYGIMEKSDKNNIFIHEFAYLKEAEEDAVDLFLALCERRPHAEQIFSMLSEDHRITTYFKEQAATEHKIDIAMWKKINFTSTFNKLQPELEARLQHSEQTALQELHLDLCSGDEHLFLDYKHEQLTISQASLPNTTYMSLVVDEIQLIKYIIWGYDEANDNSDSFSILQALFPKQNATFYFSDRF